MSYLFYGFYESSHWLGFSIILSMTTMLVIVYRGLTKRREPQTNLVFLALLLVACSYALTFINGVESVEHTLLKITEWTMYASFVYLVSNYFIPNKIHTMLFFTSIFAFMSLLVLGRIVHIQDGVLILGEGLTGSGVRLGGFFQYPNALGALVGALLLYHIIQLIVDPSLTRWLKVSIYSCVQLLGFLLIMTESRGAWLAFIIGWLVTMWLLNGEKQLQFIVDSSIMVFYSLTMYLVFTEAGFSRGQWFVPFVVLSASAVGFVCSKLPKQFGINTRWTFPILFSSGFIALFISVVKKDYLFFLFPQPLKDRISQNTSSFTDRLYYMKDGWTAIQDDFWLGAGGEAWKYKMYQVQSAPYLVHDMHNFYLQQWLETGVIGFLLLIAALGLALFFVSKHNLLVLPVLIVILVHSLFDFTLSYGTMIMLLSLFIIEGMGDKVFIRHNPGSMSVVFKGVLVLSILITVFFSVRFQQGEKAYLSALKGHSRDPLLLIQDAIQLNQYKTDYSLQYSEIPGIDYAEKRDVILNALKFEPHHALLYYQLGVIEADRGNDLEAIKAFKLSLQYDRFDQKKYEAILKYSQERSDELLKSGNEEMANLLKYEGKAIHNKWTQLKKEIEQHPLQNQRNFGLVPPM
ncbi:O-antigen ligase family protein [Bacillus dakarensis]|uniref:O-antigen ligase family protein n=1 Tax=Robertmurraya dakarensis TaxID=1926278 RepID=UPI0009813267|nr:O-antigen ligase family protein [Bacillus dakarensis]